VQPTASVIVTVYEPGFRFTAAEVVAALLHAYVYGEVPSAVVAAIDPFA
jgi:hypothetical protein